MKAVQLVAYGDAVDGLEVREFDEPVAPGAGEALVATMFAPINFNDLMVAWGIYAWKPQPPETLGNEGMGTVLAIGSGVSTVAPGDMVVLPFMSQTWRERLVVSAEDLVAIPPGADPRQAAMVAINGATVSMLLEDFVALEPGQAVAYSAATSGLGHWIAGLARRRGLRTIGLVRRTDDVQRVQESGCDVVIADDESIDKAASRIAGLDVRLALDGVGGGSVDRLLQLLGDGGTLVTYGAASGKPMEVSAQHLIFKRIRVEGFFEGADDRKPKVVPHLRRIVDLLGPDGIVQPVAGVYPLSRLKDAVRHAVAGGKILLDFQAS